METTEIKFIKDMIVEITNEDLDDDERDISLSVYECCSCHWRFIGNASRCGYGYDSEDYQAPNYCPMCGKEITNCTD
jgi:rubrerythrin